LSAESTATAVGVAPAYTAEEISVASVLSYLRARMSEVVAWRTATMMLPSESTATPTALSSPPLSKETVGGR
jgi:hypothetical protein